MGDRSAIHWTDATWNCLVGCSRVSAGCVNCYAERLVHRGLSAQHRGLTKIVNGAPHWTGEVRLVESALDLPLRWKKPRRIFVNSLSDLFHEKVPDDWLAQIFAVMWLSPRHTFQVLTKRPERALEVLSKPTFEMFVQMAGESLGRKNAPDFLTWQSMTKMEWRWPLPNVWLGVSVEDQATADERIPLLLQTPAAVRWVSYEPALGPVDFLSQWHDWLAGWTTETEADPRDGTPMPVQVQTERLNWLVVGGESGPGARPFDLAWARQTIAQGRATGVPVFLKQVGAYPILQDTLIEICHQDWPASRQCGYGWLQALDNVRETGHRALLKDRKGGDPAEWPADLRVREYPK